MDDPLEEARGFVYGHIPTVDHFRVLLLLQDDPERGWQASEIAGRLRLPPPIALTALTDLHAKGLLGHSRDEDCYRYAPQGEELAGMVRKLADFDRERPVSVIRMIYSRPTEPQAFADAFRLRKPKDP
jgi:DNA-binding MarR family transcriptional regulator